ncbi:MAG: HAMP domain-containing histidine kinase [Anaerolineae bacterium]|nr:HAMP domain-containing histidine kinase [Anaerolineae bacterium]
MELLSSLCAVGVAAALLFNLAVQPHRAPTHPQLVALSRALLLWGLLGTLVPGNYAPAASGLAATALAGFAFLARYLTTESRISHLLSRALPATLVALLLLIWAGRDTPAAHIVVYAIVLFHAGTALWTILIARHPDAAALRGAGLLMLFACASLLMLPDWLYSGAPALAAAGIAWLGWVVGRAQARQPIDQLTVELHLANRDLRQALGEAASLKAENAALSRALQTAGQHRSEFLDNLGHRLRTPLNSIIGYTELLHSGLYGDLNKKQLDRLGKIRRNSDNLLEMITNMLDLNAIDAGRLAIARAPFSLSEVIERAADTLDARRGKKRLKLIRDLDGNLPPILGDEARIYQIVAQMLDNAMKFTFEGEVTIRSRCIQVRNGVSAQFQLPVTGWLADGEWMIVEVGDTGIGIPPEDQARIFDEFYQIADPRTEQYFGTGLGLTIAKRLAELHEGALWLKSAPDRGSTVFLALPSQRKSPRPPAPYRFSRVAWMPPAERANGRHPATKK